MKWRTRVGSKAEGSAYQRIYAIVDSIPRGNVASYGQIAREAGLPGRARQVGYALRKLPAGSKLPWHRVVNSRGEIAQRAGGSARKQRMLLAREGIRPGKAGRIDLASFGWQPDW